MVQKSCDLVIRIVEYPKLSHLQFNPLHAADQKQINYNIIDPPNGIRIQSAPELDSIPI